MKGPGIGFWVIALGLVIIGIAMHAGTDYFQPAADVILQLDQHATEGHDYAVRGGTLRARVTGIANVDVDENGHRLYGEGVRGYASVEVDFAIDKSYDGWGWSSFERPILYGFISGTEQGGDVTPLSPIPPPTRPAHAPTNWSTRYAPTLQGACSTDYGHDLCRFRATVPLTGETHSLQIHLREYFR